MKKNDVGNFPVFKGKLKLLLIMKLTIFLLTCFMQVSATVYSQSTKFNFDVKNKRIVDVLREIEETSNFRFFYQREQVNVEQKINLEVKDETVEEILDILFSGQKVDFDVRQDNLILIKPQASNNNIPDVLTQQQQTISGTLTDSNGQPLPGVTVMVKGTTQGTVSGSDGKYTLSNVPQDATLVFSFVGMRTQEVKVGNQSNISISMEEAVHGLDEVIAIGYGTQKRANVIGSVSTVGTEEMTSQPVSGISNMLAGRLPGGIFIQESGQPGKDQAIIRIRGNSTLGNNSPLIVVDGIVGRDLNTLQPDDIESITVLKDASAAIYGASAANGVILVTTKRGSADRPATLTYRFYEGFLSPTMLPEMADAATYAQMIREYQSYRGTDEANMRYTPEDIAKYESGEYPWTHPNTDWYDATLRDYSSTRHHNLAAQGGSNSVNYYASFGYDFSDGIFTNNATSDNRYNLKINLDIKVNEYLSFGLDLTGIKEDKNYSPYSEYSIFDLATRMWPTSVAEWPNGQPGPDFERGLQPVVLSSNKTGFDDDKNYRSYNTLSATLKIPGIEGLILSGYYAYDLFNRRRKLFQKPWFIYNLDESAYLNAGNTGKEDPTDFLIPTKIGLPEPNLEEYFNSNESKTANIKLSYTKSFNDVHNIDAFVSYEQNEYFNEGFDAFRRFFISDRLPYLFAGGDEQKDNSGWVNLDARRNYFGRISYDYKGTYLFQFSFRRDGSLRFSEEVGRWGNFPSVLAGWRISNEEWWQNNLSFINYFKLRASWGQMGNDRIDPFQYLNMYGFARGIPLGESKSYEVGLAQVGAPNPAITWEVANMYNFGWESMFLDSKISFETDLFFERRNNILVQRDVSVPRFAGIDLPDENFGIVDNYGIETVLGYNNQMGDFNFGLEGNFAFVRNRIVESDEPERPVPWQVRTGKPQGAQLLYRAIGIFNNWDEVNSTPHVTGAQPGDIIIEDYDGDKEITGADRQLFPLTTTPEITFGLNFNLSYRNWELSGLFQGHGRALRRINPNIQQGLSGNYFMYDAIDRWTPENEDGTKPKAFNWSEEYWRSSHITTYFYHDMSFVRLKNVQLSYSISRNLVKSIGMKNARVYVSAQNLWLVWAAQDIQDPESRNVNAYPLMKVVALGAQLTF